MGKSSTHCPSSGARTKAPRPGCIVGNESILRGVYVVQRGAQSERCTVPLCRVHARGGIMEVEEVARGGGGGVLHSECVQGKRGAWI